MEQLGYVAFCTSSNRQSNGLFQVLVQSSYQPPGYLLQRIDLFLHNFYSNLSSTTEEEFAEHVAVLRSTLQRKDLTLSDQTDRFWGSISNGMLQFAYASDQVHLLESVNVTSLVEFYQSNILNPASYRKLVIAVHGKEQSAELPTNITHPLDYIHLDPTQLHYPWAGVLKSLIKMCFIFVC